MNFMPTKRDMTNVLLISKRFGSSGCVKHIASRNNRDMLKGSNIILEASVDLVVTK